MVGSTGGGNPLIQALQQLFRQSGQSPVEQARGMRQNGGASPLFSLIQQLMNRPNAHPFVQGGQSAWNPMAIQKMIQQRQQPPPQGSQSPMNNPAPMGRFQQPLPPQFSSPFFQPHPTGQPATFNGLLPLFQGGLPALNPSRGAIQGMLQQNQQQSPFAGIMPNQRSF